MVFSRFLRSAPIAFCVAVLGASRLPAQAEIEGVAVRVAEQQIRPGDRIELKFLRDFDLNTTVTVNERGETVFPKLGSVELTHIKIGALRDTLTARYNEYLRGAELQVSVFRRVVVNGEVKVPDVYYLDATSTVRDAIAKAGGTLETAHKGKVTIVRGSQRLRANAWQTNQGPENDLRSGDQVIVGRQSWLKLNYATVISTSVLLFGVVRSINW
jgi:protein involved in polysaccharide export with SLBB domain